MRSSLRSSFIRGTISVAMLGCAVLLSACAPRDTIGSVQVEIELLSVPERATAYLVDLEFWNQNGRDAILDRPDAARVLERFRVSSKTTPTTTVCAPYRYVYVCELNGRFEPEMILVQDPKDSLTAGQKFTVHFTNP